MDTNNNNKTPIIKTFDDTEYKYKQSKYKSVGKLPCRTILLAPSNSGKTVLLSNFILDIYKDCFEMIYIWSPSIDIDPAWNKVKAYIDKRNFIKDKTYYNTYNPAELHNVIDNQYNLIEYQKNKKKKHLYQICIIIDDFSDDPKFTRESKLLWSLMCRGRHMGISVFISSQKFASSHPIIRCNCSQYIVFKIRNMNDLDLFLTEVGALLKDKKTLYKVYELATQEKYSFLYIDLCAPLENMFFIRFDKLIKITDV